MEILVLAVFALGVGGAMGLFDGGSGSGGGGGGGTTPPSPNVNPNVIDGDNTDEVIQGTNDLDHIFAQGGDDTVYGRSDDDRIFLGDGDDSTVPAASAPYFGQGGDDFIRGGAGADEIADSLGANTVHGDTGADIISTLDLFASSTAADESDILFGGFGADVLMGDEGDVMTGGAQSDVFMVLVHPNNDEPVQITDFDENEDAGISLVLSNTTDPSAVGNLNNVVDHATRITQAVAAGGVMISLDGQEVAFVQGATTQVAAAQLALIEAITPAST